MLAIVNRLALTHLAAGEEIGIPTPSNRPRLQADHAPEAEVARSDFAIRHPHEPVDASCLIVASIAGLVQVLHERASVCHERPDASLPMNRVHRSVIG